MMNDPQNPKRKKMSLGRGLSSLIPEAMDSETDLSLVYAERDSFACDITMLTPCRFQPRRTFAEDEIEALARSIREQGIIQPLIVRKHGTGYELITGERRLRAAKKAGLEKVPVVVKNVDDNAVLEMALVENIQREDLNAIEEALAIQKLVEVFGLTQENAADRLGRSRSAVANTLRLLALPDEIKDYVTSQQLSAGHARALLGLDNEQAQILLARKIIAQNLSVRQTEELVRKAKALPKTTQPKAKSSTQIYFENLAHDLSSQWGTKIEINKQGKKGKVTIEFYSDDDLNSLVDKLQSLK